MAQTKKGAKMARYVDTDLLKPDYFVPSTSTGTVSTQYVSLFQILNAPTADVVAVVRCKDCEYYVETNGRIGTCELTISGAKDDGFCAWGERKK